MIDHLLVSAVDERMMCECYTASLVVIIIIFLDDDGWGGGLRATLSWFDGLRRAVAHYFTCARIRFVNFREA